MLLLASEFSSDLLLLLSLDDHLMSQICVYFQPFFSKVSE